MEPTQAALATMNVLRDGSLYKWYVIPLLVLTVYVYAVQIQKRDWSVVLAGLAFWGMDWFNEIWNGLLFHFTNHAPAWGVAKDSAFIILIGLNIEICFMFAMLGVVFCMTLPPDKNSKVLGVPNRWFYAVAGSILCVIIEMMLHQAGALVWEWTWWNTGAPWLIFLLGYLPFYVVSFWVYDMPAMKKKITVVSIILGFDALCLIVFAGFLKWI